MSLIPIRDSDFSFVPQSWHVDDTTSFTLSFPSHDSYVFMSVWTNAINFFYIFLTWWGRLMRHICAITNIDHSAFLTKIIAIYLHHQRSRIREKLPLCLCRCTDPKLCLLITHKIQDLKGPFLFKRRQKIWRAFQNWGKNSRSPNQYCAKAEFWGLFWQCSIVTMATDLASETSLKNYLTMVVYRCQNVFLPIGSTFYKFHCFTLNTGEPFRAFLTSK